MAVGYLVQNGDWICHGPEEENGTKWLNETLKTDCSFRYYRPKGIVITLLSLCIIPANCYAIYKFYLRNVNKMFFVLTTSLCICNFFMSINGLYIGLVNIFFNRNTTSIGYAGCVFCFTSTMITSSSTMIIQAIISFERRKVITSTTFITVNSRVYIFLSLMVVYTISVAFIFFLPVGTLSYIEARIDRNSTETIWVCTTKDVVFTGFVETIWSTLVFGIPLAIIFYNYWPIWKQAHQKIRMESTTTISSNQKRMQLRLAVIMSLTVIEFVIFQLPMSLMILATIIEKVTNHLTININLLTFNFCLWYFDSIINPLWTVLLTKRRQGGNATTTTIETAKTVGTTTNRTSK